MVDVDFGITSATISNSTENARKAVRPRFTLSEPSGGRRKLAVARIPSMVDGKMRFTR